jgi:hypothetical protein
LESQRCCDASEKPRTVWWVLIGLVLFLALEVEIWWEFQCWVNKCSYKRFIYILLFSDSDKCNARIVELLRVASCIEFSSSFGHLSIRLLWSQQLFIKFFQLAVLTVISQLSGSNIDQLQELWIRLWFTM